jgi:hypothetical protein
MWECVRRRGSRRGLRWEVVDAAEALAAGFPALADIRAEARDRDAVKNKTRLRSRMT